MSGGFGSTFDSVVSKAAERQGSIMFAAASDMSVIGAAPSLLEPK